MSALWPHIRALRAEAKALSDLATELENIGDPFLAKIVLGNLAAAKLMAADELEAGVKETLERVQAKRGQ